MNMNKLSGFTFIHNALDGGYPIVEAIHAVQPWVDEVVVVDCASTDGTRDLLRKMTGIPIFDANDETRLVPLKVVDGKWGNRAGETLRQAHSQYVKCEGDIIVHFEADEVYDESLIKAIVSHTKVGKIEDCHMSVMRLQLEQNFQRCRWYPEPVHRVFPKMSRTRKEGHTTDQAEKSFLLTEKNGYLWDITNCFRDNWLKRVEQQARLRDDKPQYIFVPLHTLHRSEFSEDEAKRIVHGRKIWTWTNTPFNIPEILKPLVGITKYEPKL